MRFLLTMNMPSAKGYPVHQMTIEHKARDIHEFWEALTDNEFIVCNLFYKITNDDNRQEWSDRGTVIVNTSFVGKAQEYVEFYGDRDDRY